MELIHFASRKQVGDLLEIFAKPIEENGQIVWVAPEWYEVMFNACAS